MSFLISQDGDVVHMHDNRIPPDEEWFKRTVMVHKTCGGFVNVRRTSESVQAIYCNQCGLRVTVPVRIRTFGDFRRYLATGTAPTELMVSLAEVVAVVRDGFARGWDQMDILNALGALGNVNAPR